MEPPATCGQGLAARAPLLYAVARVVASMADNLELHLASLRGEDAASRPEWEAYRELAGRHRRSADELFALAELMLGYRDLPMAEHDPEALGRPEVIEAFRELARCEDALLVQLTAVHAADRDLLTGLDAT